LVDGGNNFHLLVEEGSGRMIGFPNQVGLAVETDVVRIEGAAGQVIPVKVDGCDWMYAAVSGGEVRAVLQMDDEGLVHVEQAWIQNPNAGAEAAVLPEPTATKEPSRERQVGMLCYQDAELGHDNCTKIVAEMFNPLPESEVSHLMVTDAMGNLSPLQDGRLPDLDYHSPDGSYSLYAIACTVRGWVDNSLRGDASMEAICEVRMPDKSQYFPIGMNIQSGSRTVGVLAEGVVDLNAGFSGLELEPRSYDEVNSLFRNPEMVGQQVINFIQVHHDDKNAQEPLSTVYENTMKFIRAMDDERVIDLRDYFSGGRIVVLPEEVAADLP
jgi:hypothetical protein